MSRRALAVLALLAAAPAFGEEPALEVALEPPSATVGDLVGVTLALRLPAADAALTPLFPAWGTSWGAAEVRAAAPPRREATADGVVWRQQLTLSAYRTGRVTLPPVAVALPRQPPTALPTPADLAFEVRSVLPVEPANRQPSAPAPPVGLELSAAFWWLAAALLLAVLAAAWLLRRQLRREPLAVAHSRSPWAEFTAALGAIDPRDVASAHAALSLALRRYFGRSFAMPAAESSTRELGQRLAGRALDAELVRRAVRLLRDVDQVKFARVPATADRAATRIAEARTVAAGVEAHLHPPTPPSATESAA